MHEITLINILQLLIDLSLVGCSLGEPPTSVKSAYDDSQSHASLSVRVFGAFVNSNMAERGKEC